MNCSPNSPAMIVRNTYGLACVSALIGTPLTVTYLRTDDAYGMGPVWAFRGQPLRCPNCGNSMIGMLDADLQQLRPPRAETVYEVIDDAMRPHRQVEHAR